MIRKLFLLHLSLVAILFFVYPSLALENIRVATASTTSPSFLYLLVAQREGYFKEEGVHLEVINIRGEIAVKTALAGEVGFFTQSGSALAGAVRGVPVKILLVADDKPPWDLIAQPQIVSFSQLKGGAIGVLSLEGSVAVITREMLRKNGIDPAKEVNLMVMGSNETRLLSLRGKAIQATLLDPANSFRAQREGFTKLASAADYVSHYLGGGIVVAADERIRPAADKISRFIRGALKGLYFFLNKREASISHMVQFLKMKDRDAVTAIYASSARAMTQDGMVEEQTLRNLIEDMRKTTGVKKEFRPTDIFDFSYVRKANEQLKSTGWKP